MSQARTQITQRSHRTALIAAVAAMTLAASAPGFAGGEFLDIEQPSLRTPIENTADATLTRAQVREELRQARAIGTMSMGGELGDTDAVLAARESFNIAQAQAITAAYAAQAAFEAALAQAEMDRMQAEAELAPSSDPNNNLSLEFVGGDSEQAAQITHPAAQRTP